MQTEWRRPPPDAVETAILDDIHTRTGLRATHLQSLELDTKDQRVADAILPILCEWVPLVKPERDRWTVYSLFHTPRAFPYIDHVIEWWLREPYGLAVGTLTQVLVVIARPDNAERLWRLCQENPGKPFHFMLLSRLAAFPSVEREVKDALVEALEHRQVRPPRRYDHKLMLSLGPLPPEERAAILQRQHPVEDEGLLTVGDLQYISEVNDPRIRKWLEGQVDSPNRDLRTLARRVLARGQRLPKGVEFAAREPDRAGELFSTEVDIWEVRALLARLAKQHALKIPNTVRGARFLSSLDVDRWVSAPIESNTGEPYRVWFRLEDVDTVEVVLTKEPPGRTPTIQ